ncbi:MAG: hypothetical protein H7321_06255 [Bacteroidia bacterium]|nr:hypothetical protein [Bacteroidia bacterium]
MKYLKAILIIVCFSGIISVRAQVDDDDVNDRIERNRRISDSINGPNKLSNIKDRLSYGGYGGLVIGTVTNISVAPTIGYKLTTKNTLGIGANYVYYSDRRYTPTYSTSIYGGNLFDRQFVTDQIFLHVEHQVLNYEDGTGHRGWNSYTLAGGGYAPSQGVYIAILYIVDQPAQGIYGPVPLIIRFGFMF